MMFAQDDPQIARAHADCPKSIGANLRNLWIRTFP
jgi:hypothetical protein